MSFDFIDNETLHYKKKQQKGMNEVDRGLNNSTNSVVKLDFLTRRSSAAVLNHTKHSTECPADFTVVYPLPYLYTNNK